MTGAKRVFPDPRLILPVNFPANCKYCNKSAMLVLCFSARVSTARDLLFQALSSKLPLVTYVIAYRSRSEFIPSARKIEFAETASTILRSLKRLSADGQSKPAGLRDLRHISEWHPAGWW